MPCNAFVFSFTFLLLYRSLFAPIFLSTFRIDNKTIESWPRMQNTEDRENGWKTKLKMIIIKNQHVLFKANGKMLFLKLFFPLQFSIYSCAIIFPCCCSPFFFLCLQIPAIIAIFFFFTQSDSHDTSPFAFFSNKEKIYCYLFSSLYIFISSSSYNFILMIICFRLFVFIVFIISQLF